MTGAGDGVRLERVENGAVALVTLARPERMNALSSGVVVALGAIGRELDADAALRAVVLTGAGDRAFSAGADLKERASMSEGQVRELIRLYRSELAWLGKSRAPVVAAINGVALGGGLELALACDLRVAVESAVLGLPETSLAIIPAAGGTQRLPRIIGEARAKEMILLARRISAAEALSIGLVHRVCPAGEPLLEHTLRWLAPIVQGAPIAQRAALRALRAAELPLEEGLDAELAAYEDCLQSEDRKEALRAFQEKRSAKFEGR